MEDRVEDTNKEKISRRRTPSCSSDDSDDQEECSTSPEVAHSSSSVPFVHNRSQSAQGFSEINETDYQQKLKKETHTQDFVATTSSTKECGEVEDLPALGGPQAGGVDLTANTATRKIGFVGGHGFLLRAKHSDSKGTTSQWPDSSNEGLATQQDMTNTQRHLAAHEPTNIDLRTEKGHPLLLHYDIEGPLVQRRMSTKSPGLPATEPRNIDLRKEKGNPSLPDSDTEETQVTSDRNTTQLNGPSAEMNQISQGDDNVHASIEARREESSLNSTVTPSSDDNVSAEVDNQKGRTDVDGTIPEQAPPIASVLVTINQKAFVLHEISLEMMRNAMLASRKVDNHSGTVPFSKDILDEDLQQMVDIQNRRVLHLPREHTEMIVAAVREPPHPRSDSMGHPQLTPNIELEPEDAQQQNAFEPITPQRPGFQLQQTHSEGNGAARPFDQVQHHVAQEHAQPIPTAELEPEQNAQCAPQPAPSQQPVPTCSEETRSAPPQQAVQSHVAQEHPQPDSGVNNGLEPEGTSGELNACQPQQHEQTPPHAQNEGRCATLPPDAAPSHVAQANADVENRIQQDRHGIELHFTGVAEGQHAIQESAPQQNSTLLVGQTCQLEHEHEPNNIYNNNNSLPSASSVAENDQGFRDLAQNGYPLSVSSVACSTSHQQSVLDPPIPSLQQLQRGLGCRAFLDYSLPWHCSFEILLDRHPQERCVRCRLDLSEDEIRRGHNCPTFVCAFCQQHVHVRVQHICPQCHEIICRQCESDHECDPD